MNPRKATLITGAARRIGATIVRRLHAEGMAIALHYHRSRDEAEALASELNAVRPDSVLPLCADLCDTARIPGLIEACVAAFGRLDVLINNASSFYPTPLAEVDEQAWDNLVGTNLKAPLFLARAAARPLATNGGCIVNIADLYGVFPLAGYTVYSAAKAGLIMLTRALAAELAPDVRVNAVAPGAILWSADHDREVQRERERILARTALGRLGQPEDIAAAVLYLARDAAYTTGAVLPVDGGRGLIA